MNEDLEQSRETTTTPVMFTIWYRTDVTEKMRVLHENEYFDIQRINKVGQRNEMLKLVTIKKF
jgi:SPP1 family predicted phage head-tail adaptor